MENKPLIIPIAYLLMKKDRELSLSFNNMYIKLLFSF